MVAEILSPATYPTIKWSDNLNILDDSVSARTTITDCRVSFVDFFLVFLTNFSQIGT